MPLRASPLGPLGPFVLNSSVVLGRFSVRCLSLVRAAQALTSVPKEHDPFPEDLLERPLRGTSTGYGGAMSPEKGRMRHDRSFPG